MNLIAQLDLSTCDRVGREQKLLGLFKVLIEAGYAVILVEERYGVRARLRLRSLQSVSCLGNRLFVVADMRAAVIAARFLSRMQLHAPYRRMFVVSETAVDMVLKLPHAGITTLTGIVRKLSDQLVWAVDPLDDELNFFSTRRGADALERVPGITLAS